MDSDFKSIVFNTLNVISPTFYCFPLQAFNFDFLSLFQPMTRTVRICFQLLQVAHVISLSITDTLATISECNSCQENKTFMPRPVRLYPVGMERGLRCNQGLERGLRCNQGMERSLRCNQGMERGLRCNQGQERSLRCKQRQERGL